MFKEKLRLSLHALGVELVAADYLPGDERTLPKWRFEVRRVGAKEAVAVELLAPAGAPSLLGVVSAILGAMLTPRDPAPHGG